MRAGLIISFLLLLTSPLLAQHIHGVPALDTVAEKAKNVLAFPFVVRSLETNWGFGGIAARFFRPMNDTSVRTSDINVLGLYTLRRQLILVVSSTIFFAKEDQLARFQASYSYYPDDFWGLGNHTPYNNEEGFSQKQYFINPQFLQRVHRKMYFGVTYEFQHSGPISYTPGGLFDQENIIGRYGCNTSGIGPILSWDTRNNAYSLGSNGTFQCLALLDEEPKRLGFYSYCPAACPQDAIIKMAELLMRLNGSIFLGNFLLNFENGTIIYKTALFYEDVDLTSNVLDNIVIPNVSIMDDWTPVIMRLIYGNLSPLEAFHYRDQSQLEK